MQAATTAGSAQWTAAAVPAAQSPPSGQAYECVQVPVTYNQTCYRHECRTETVPVTRMVPEMRERDANRHLLHTPAADGSTSR